MYTNEVPFDHISPAELRDLVAHQHVRPERPEDDEAPQLNNEVWELAECCWASDPRSRPIGSAICDDIRAMLDRRTSRPVSPEPKAGKPSPVSQQYGSECERIPLNGLLIFISLHIIAWICLQREVPHLNPPVPILAMQIRDHRTPPLSILIFLRYHPLIT